MHPNPARCDLSPGVVGHFEVVFPPRECVALRQRYIVVGVLFRTFGKRAPGGGGYFGEGGVVAVDGGLDCEGGVGEGGCVGGDAGGEG